MAGLQLATAQSPEQYARLLAFAGGTDVWVAGGNPGYDVGTCTSTKWNDWPCYELLEYVCQTACPVPPPPPPPVAAGPTRERVGQRSGREAVGRRPSSVVQRAAVVQADGVRLLWTALARLRSYGAVEPFHEFFLTAKRVVVLLPGRMCV